MNQIDICVIHAQPIEKYPPAQNLLTFLGQETELNVLFIVGSGVAPGSEYIIPIRDRFQVEIMHIETNQGLGWKLSFIKFVKTHTASKNLKCLYAYGDEFSASCSLLFKATSRAVHFHELTKPLSLLRKFSTKFLETWYLQKTLRRFDWITQVTPARAAIFARDFSCSCDHLYNFPPRQFSSQIQSFERTSDSVRLIYIGTCNPRVDSH